jgi:hypothetical protein
VNSGWLRAFIFLTTFYACEGHREKEISMIEEVLKRHTDELMSLPGVVGTAIGLCEERPCIKVYVVEKTPELEERIPDTLEGHRVVMEESGEFRRLKENGD